ncbi:MAG: hypothetical protein ABI134_22910, partial [Byssovorax sp.]
KSGPSIAVIAIIAIVAFIVLGFGGCAVCVCMGAKGSTASSGSGGGTSDNWINSEHPAVKFIAPAGWTKTLSGEWGTFKAPDGAAVFAFTTFTQPGESTARLSQAAGVLGVTDVDWRNPKTGTVGRDGFAARMGEGTCNFRGPGGYIWYATVNTGTSDQILLIYTVSSRGTQADKDAVLKTINSLQRR